MGTFRTGWGPGTRGKDIPGSIGLIAALVAGFLLYWMTERRLADSTFFVPVDWFQRPWTILTYAFVPSDVLGLIFSCMWIYGIGQVVEREIGTAKYLGVWFTIQILAALMLWAGAVILERAAMANGPWVCVVALTVVWATRYPNQEIMFMFVLRVAAKWVALISFAILFFAYPPMLAPFVAAPIALAYFFAADKLPIRYSRSYAQKAPSKTQQKREREYFDKVKDREQERQERERLRKLFEDSLLDDPDKKD